MIYRGSVATPNGMRAIFAPDAPEVRVTDQQAALREAEHARFQAGLAAREAEEAEREKEAAANRAKMQQAAAETLDADLRARFFAANPGGSEADFKRLLPQLRDAEMTRRTETARDAEVEGLARRFHAYTL